MVEKSKVIGIMLQHSDGDKEYYEPELLKEDIEAIFKILEKYGMEVPCYQDENGKIYFDENNGRNGLDLYTGAYMDCGEICGEPCNRVTEPVECENPFVRSPKEREYMLLNRLQLDCKYYINCAGKCRSSSLWADIDTIIKEMENIMDSFTEEEKPEWLTDADFEALKKEIKEIHEHEAENVQ